jgi:hypothetical protein
VSASLAGRKEERDRDRSSEGEAVVCVGFCFSLRDVLVIHDSESLSKPTTSCGSILSMGAANCRTAQPVGTDIQDGGYELPRIPLFPRRS